MVLGVYLNTITNAGSFQAEPTEYFIPKPPPSLQINRYRGYSFGELFPVPLKEWNIPPLRHMPARRAQGQFYFYIPQLYSITSENRRRIVLKNFLVWKYLDPARTIFPNGRTLFRAPKSTSRPHSSSTATLKTLEPSDRNFLLLPSSAESTVLQKLTVDHLVKKRPVSTKPTGSLPSSRNSSLDPNP